MEFLPQPKKFHRSRKPSMKSRKKFSKAVLEEAYENYNGLCGVCRLSVATDPHHIRFKSDNGKGVLTNCLPVCRECHQEIHRNAELALQLREKAKKEHGPLYWADEWDKEWMV